jgi:predicted amidohydrolase YtcJ
MSSRTSRTAASSRAALGSRGYPDSIFTNGKIITADPDFSVVNAVAIRDGRFVAVGTVEEVGVLAGPSTVIVDLKGSTVLPGLIDTHAHVERAGLIKYTVQLNDVTSVAQALGGVDTYFSHKTMAAIVTTAQ